MPKLSIIDNKMIIKDILNNISKNNKIPVSAQVGNKKESVELKFSEFSPLPYLIFKEKATLVNAGNKIEISFFYNQRYFDFETNVENIDGEYYYILIPEKIYSVIKRKTIRYRVKNEDNVAISLNSLENKYKVIDVSINGLCFVADKDLFAVEQIIKNIMLVIDDGSPAYINAIVKNVIPIGENYYRFGIKFLGFNFMFYVKLLKFIFQKNFSYSKLMKRNSKLMKRNPKLMKLNKY